MIKLSVWYVDFAHPHDRWHACVGDYDLDDLVGTGSTPAEAVADLMEKREPPLDD